MAMSQKERDRYNIARGGVAGMKTLIPAKKGVGSAPIAAAPIAAVSPAPIAATSGTTTLGGFNPEWFMKEYDEQKNKANAANEQRYAEINQGYGALQGQQKSQFDALNAAYGQRYDRNMKMLEGMGLQEQSDINEAMNAQAGNMRQQMVGMGLGGTTILPTMQAGLERQRIAEQGRLGERLRGQKLGADMQLSGDQLAYQERGGGDAMRLGQEALNFKERRNDVAPDFGAMANIALAMGKGGYGASGPTAATGTAPMAGVGGMPTLGGGYGIPPAQKPAAPSVTWISGEAFRKDPRTGQLVRDYTIKPKYAGNSYAGGLNGGLGY